MALETYPYDHKRYLQTPDDQALSVRMALEEGDALDVVGAVMLIAEVRGLDELAARARLWWESVASSTFTAGPPPKIDISVDEMKAMLAELGFQLTTASLDQLGAEAA